MKPKVLVSAPINYAKLYCWELFAHSLSFLTYDNYEVLLVETDGDLEMQYIIRNFGFDCETLNSNKKMMDKVVDARNFILEYANKNNFDYVLMLDADAILPEDIIEKLLIHNKDFVSAAMFGMNSIGFPQLVAMENTDDNDANSWHVSEEKLDTGLIPIVKSGMGCALISRKVFEKVKFRCIRDDKGRVKLSEDYCFSLDAIEQGFDIWLDTNMQVKHLIQGQWQWDKA